MEGLQVKEVSKFELVSSNLEQRIARLYGNIADMQPILEIEDTELSAPIWKTGH